jgi:hypothetical protein
VPAAFPPAGRVASRQLSDDELPVVDDGYGVTAPGRLGDAPDLARSPDNGSIPRREPEVHQVERVLAVVVTAEVAFAA